MLSPPSLIAFRDNITFTFCFLWFNKCAPEHPVFCQYRGVFL